MDIHDQPSFFHALQTLAAVCCDELDELRLEAYWDLFAEECSLEEWQTVCHAALRGETFHKLPMPATLLRYLDTLRQPTALRVQI